MKRVVITGMGIVSSLGNNVSEVEKSLQDAKSGVTFQPEYESHGLRSQVAGSININVEELIDRLAPTLIPPKALAVAIGNE